MNIGHKPSDSDVIDAKFALVRALFKCKVTSSSVVSHMTVPVGTGNAYECLSFRLKSAVSNASEVMCCLFGFVAEGRLHWHVSARAEDSDEWRCDLKDLPAHLTGLERYVALAGRARQAHE